MIEHCLPANSWIQRIEVSSDLATYFGERRGIEVDPLNVKVSGDWLFYRNHEWPDEVECYRLPLPDCAEPWDVIPLIQSPFNKHAIMEKTIDELNGAYPEED